MNTRRCIKCKTIYPLDSDFYREISENEYAYLCEKCRRLWESQENQEWIKSEENKKIIKGNRSGTCSSIKREEVKNLLNRFGHILFEREQKILKFRFGIDNGVTRTLEMIGDEMGLTRERIRQIEVRAIRKLRKADQEKHE